MRTHEALQAGATRGELAGRGWEAPFRGAQRPSTPDGLHPAQRIYDAAAVLPEGAALGGWAAGYLLGAHDLDGRGGESGPCHPVPIVLPPPLSIRPRPGISLVRSALDPTDVREVHGIPCTVGARTAFDLARGRPLAEAVVALDVLGRMIGVLPAAVRAYTREHAGWKGVPAAHRAIDLADPRALSAGESRFRVLWVVEAGLPAPEVNPLLFDPSGFFLGMVDLLDPETGLAGEYDGAHHREAQSHADDNAREEWLEDAGLTVVRACGTDLGRHRLRTVRRLQTAHRRAARRATAGDHWLFRPRPFPSSPPAPAPRRQPGA